MGINIMRCNSNPTTFIKFKIEIIRVLVHDIIVIEIIEVTVRKVCLPVSVPIADIRLATEACKTEGDASLSIRGPRNTSCTTSLLQPSEMGSKP